MLVESPEALNIIKEGHIKSIISLLDKHGRNHKVQTLTLFLYTQTYEQHCISLYITKVSHTHTSVIHRGISFKVMCK